MNTQADALAEYMRGFLKAIEIATGRQARMTVNWYTPNGDPVEGLATFLRERDIGFDRLVASAISRETFLAEAWKTSTDLMTCASASVLRDVKWQFEECLGLVSTSIGKDQPFHPLFHCPLHRVLIEGDNPEVALLIEFEKLVVAVFCEF